MKGKKIVATILALALTVFPSFSTKAEVVSDILPSYYDLPKY